MLKVVYPLGDVTDPITNKKVAAVRNGTVRYRFVLSMVVHCLNLFIALDYHLFRFNLNLKIILINYFVIGILM